jgi:hypothetical protein
MNNEIGTIQRQLNSNNNQMQRLIHMLERLRTDNSILMTRLHTAYRELRSNDERGYLQRDRDVERARGPREGNVRMEDIQPDADILFYFYLPRNLTPEIIRRETTIVKFSEIECPGNLACPICLEPFESQQLVTMINHCKHIFNTSQLSTWFDDKTTCPVCRYDLQRQRVEERNDISISTSNIFDTMNHYLNRNN